MWIAPKITTTSTGPHAASAEIVCPAIAPLNTHPACGTTPPIHGFSGRGTDIWVAAAAPEHTGSGFHRKRAGLNHVAFSVDRREDVDRFQAEFLAPRKLAALYGTPREFPQYRPGYYAVFFEDPDRLKLEIVHIPTAPPA